MSEKFYLGFTIGQDVFSSLVSLETRMARRLQNPFSENLPGEIYSSEIVQFSIRKGFFRDILYIALFYYSTFAFEWPVGKMSAKFAL